MIHSRGKNPWIRIMKSLKSAVLNPELTPTTPTEIGIDIGIIPSRPNI